LKWNFTRVHATPSKRWMFLTLSTSSSLSQFITKFRGPCSTPCRVRPLSH
jgi:hypothetical protein